MSAPARKKDILALADKSRCDISAPTARERVLGRLRAAGAGAVADLAELDRRIDAHYEGRRDPLKATSTDHAVESMLGALTAAHATVWCADAVSWPLALAQRLATAGVRRLLLDTASAEGAALALCLSAAIEAVSFDRPIEAWKTDLFENIDAGLTVARSGIAATGTLVLAPDPGAPRTVSLVPPLHVALVYARTLHADLHAAVKAERWRDGMPANLVLVSGPSKTSDIQQTLAYGAHGPRQLWVVIVTETAGVHGESR